MTEPSTPLMRQYHAIKLRYPLALLLFRLGDFYELFYEDAIVASRELQITLTARNRERGQPIPMCGVPYHAAENYIARLIRAGYKIAVCDQMELPGPGKKLVRREVVRVITPGTATDVHVLDAKENNFLAALARDPAGDRIGLAYVDISTGEFQATEFSGPGAEKAALDELHLLNPRETLLPRQENLFSGGAPGELEGAGGLESRLEEWVFRLDYAERVLREQFGVVDLEAFGLTSHPQATAAAGALIHYLRETSAKAESASNLALQHIDRLRYYQQHDALVLDPVSVRNLELVSSLYSEDAARGRAPTLLTALDETCTSMGARLLRAWMLRPEISIDEIEARLDAVAQINSHPIVREELRKELQGILDLERLTSRITLGVASPRELIALRQSLTRVPLLRGLLAPPESRAGARLSQLNAQLDDLADVRELIERAIAEEPPAQATDPGIVRSGYNAELDELRNLSRHGKQIIAMMEERERKRTGIGSLKIRFNQIFGYYIEISKPNLHLVPADFERKQTLVNAERFTAPELKEHERKILAADERILEIERRLFLEVRGTVAAKAHRLRKTAAAIAQLDVLVNFARLAAERDYARPELNATGELLVVAGRHPVVERILAQRGDRFVPNDLYLNSTQQQILVITGPNMGGKSTYLRQAALIVLMAQIGSFVPARSAKLPLTDRIFTRIGASDNLARGRSTFLVEMSEVAAILNSATPASLVLLDEVGRGTSTFDGLSIAWAVVEHLQQHTRARTLFATHYHELTELAELLPGVKNVHVSVAETSNDIVFLRRVEPGSADKSYGIEVARLAGLPPSVIVRAREVLQRHEQNEHQLSEKLTPGASPHTNSNGIQQALFTPIDRAVLEELRRTDLDNLKPLEALNLLAQLKKQIS
jgi:DNA mismatch repair protein MutS